MLSLRPLWWCGQPAIDLHRCSSDFFPTPLSNQQEKPRGSVLRVRRAKAHPAPFTPWQASSLLERTPLTLEKGRVASGKEMLINSNPGREVAGGGRETLTTELRKEPGPSSVGLPQALCLRCYEKTAPHRQPGTETFLPKHGPAARVPQIQWGVNSYLFYIPSGCLQTFFPKLRGLQRYSGKRMGLHQVHSAMKFMCYSSIYMCVYIYVFTQPSDLVPSSTNAQGKHPEREGEGRDWRNTCDSQSCGRWRG